jgi:hypothetical protein
VDAAPPRARKRSYPQRRADKRLEDLARELMTVTAMLCSGELRSRLCEAETVKRAKRHCLRAVARAG